MRPTHQKAQVGGREVRIIAQIGAMEQLPADLEIERTAHRKAAALAASAKSWREVRNQGRQRYQVEIDNLRAELAMP